MFSYQSEGRVGQYARGSPQHLSDVDQVCDCLVNVSPRRQAKKKYRFIDNLYFERNFLMCFLFGVARVVAASSLSPLRRIVRRVCSCAFDVFVCVCIPVFFTRMRGRVWMVVGGWRGRC